MAKVLLQTTPPPCDLASWKLALNASASWSHELPDYCMYTSILITSHPSHAMWDECDAFCFEGSTHLLMALRDPGCFCLDDKHSYDGTWLYAHQQELHASAQLMCYALTTVH